MIFESFLNRTVYLYLLYEYFNNKFPEKTQSFLINVSYYSIYFFSKLQIFLNKRKNDIYLHLKKNENYNKYIEKMIEIKSFLSDKFLYFINTYFDSNDTSSFKNNDRNKEQIIFDFIIDNKVNFSISKEELIDNLESTIMDNALLDSSDFVLVYDLENNIKIVDKELITLKNLKSEDSFLNQIRPVKYKPLLCEMIVNSLNIKISFSDRDGKYNYLVLDNQFDYKFLQYFMIKHYKFNLTDDFVYELKILDDKVETISIYKNEILKIQENQIVKL